MEELVQEGLVRQIGISNFNKSRTKQILRDAWILPGLENDPFLQQTEFVDWKFANGLRLMTHRLFTPEDYEPYVPFPGDTSLKRPILNAFCGEKGFWWPSSHLHDICTAMMQWSFPKATMKREFRRNSQAQDIRSSDDDVQAINAYEKKTRLVNPSDGWGVKLFDGLDGV
jgi:diketogulonate reductase-like aldo/keto reductase